MNGAKQNKSKKTGHSLIEALVALGILLLGIVPVITLATQALLFHYRASETEEAARISQTMIDYIKSRGYDDLSVISGEKYSLTSTTGGAFTMDTTVNDFGKDIVLDENDRISNDLILLNSKGINLNDVNFYLVMDRVKGELQNSSGVSDSYIDPVTGVSTGGDAYKEDLIYGKFTFGYGKDGQTTDTGRKTEMETIFIITPIENWK